MCVRTVFTTRDSTAAIARADRLVGGQRYPEHGESAVGA